MKKDPKLRTNHLCRGPNCHKPLPRIAVVHSDPFCSQLCCSAWHGIELRFPVKNYWSTAQAQGHG